MKDNRYFYPISMTQTMCAYLFLSLLLCTVFGCTKDDESMQNDDLSGIDDQRIISIQEQMIYDLRSENNKALATKDASKVASIYTQDFFVLSSTNGLFVGKDQLENIYQSLFESRDSLLFVRTPLQIKANIHWKMASEYGVWTGTWMVDGVPIKVEGDYYAKWHKKEGLWLLRSEIYTQLACSGDVVCNNLPIL